MAAPATTASPLGTGRSDFSNVSGTVASAEFVPVDRAVSHVFAIHTTAPKVVRVKVEWLSLMNHSSCVNESLTVLDGDPGSGDPESLAVLCGTGRGSVPPHSLKSTGQSLSLVLNSTGPLEGRGFRISYVYVGRTQTSRDCGVETMGQTQPWLAQLQSTSGNFASCDSTLLNAQWLLTSASCFSGTSALPVDWRAAFNNSNFQPLAAIHLHPKFNATTSDYDAALVQLSYAIPLSDAVRPACLPDRREPNLLPGKSCSVASIQAGSQIVRRVNIVGQEECRAVNSSSSSSVRAVTSRMICASNQFCGSLASPLLCREVDGRWYVMGVGSWGLCSSPAVFTRLSKILEFVKQTAV
ncbi:transmembrane protease serine 9-like [Lethenteron reissneri]|uniref:transmembrane protease serine 9-like n=1 Tax=Lethenteron reissneri TaxID=7753 RepID=UPI002AB6D0EE|nr:transmembrane protease serine 9-like [Lethenteron reissneri]